MTANAKPQQDPAQRYQVIKKIDAGGMAEIFLAKSMSIQGMEKHVAIKRVLPSLTKNQKFIEMFLDEARLSIVLNHANIVQVFDVSQSGGTYFIVMEYVDGFNVRHLFQRASEIGYRIPVAVAVYIIIEVCKGLEHAHTKRDLEGKHLRIVHRDLSPPNVLVSRSGEVKITDFGLAKATSQLTRTDPGVVKGKYSYLSPEVTEGKPADLRTDIFAAGIVLWELLANRRLFFGKTDVETVDMVRKAEVPQLSKLNPDVSPELETIISKALARDPKKRFTSAREMGEELADLLAKQATKATSFDLSQMVDRLFGPVGGGPASSNEVASQRQARIASMIDEEIANLSMLGFSPQVRGIQGSEPIDPTTLGLAALNRPRFELVSVWAKTGGPRPVVSDARERAPTLRAMEDVGDLSGLVRMLEGTSMGTLDWPDPSGKNPVPITGAAARPSTGGGNGMLWALISLGAAGVAAALFFLLK
ncbi:MAG: serine/threonine protein kinase [Deltaproteobacteria bacterium]|nr:serine/threonine protein kinase [Deltaproteobacteria bacterium]